MTTTRLKGASHETLRATVSWLLNELVGPVITFGDPGGEHWSVRPATVEDVADRLRQLRCMPACIRCHDGPPPEPIGAYLEHHGLEVAEGYFHILCLSGDSWFALCRMPPLLCEFTSLHRKILDDEEDGSDE